MPNGADERLESGGGEGYAIEHLVRCTVHLLFILLLHSELTNSIKIFHCHHSIQAYK